MMRFARVLWWLLFVYFTQIRELKNVIIFEGKRLDRYSRPLTFHFFLHFQYLQKKTSQGSFTLWKVPSYSCTKVKAAIKDDVNMFTVTSSDFQIPRWAKRDGVIL